MVQVIPLLPGLGVPEADVRAEVDELLAAGQHLGGDAGHGARIHGGEHHITVPHDHIQGGVVQRENLLVVEAHQSGVLVLNLAPGGEAVGQVGHLGLRVVHHQAEKLTKGIAGSAANRKTDHDTLPP